MDRDDAIYGLKCGVRWFVITFKMLRVYCLQHWSLKISKMYTKWLKAFINKPKLFNVIFKRSCAWTLRTAYWQDRFDELEQQSTKIYEEIAQLKSFYNI